MKGAVSYGKHADVSTYWSAARRATVAGWGFLAVLAGGNDVLTEHRGVE
jgi:hypothetical protein